MSSLKASVAAHMAAISTLQLRRAFRRLGLASHTSTGV